MLEYFEVLDSNPYCAGQDQTIIVRAAVAAARMVEEGKAPSKYWVVEQADIVKFGRDEWTR